MKCNRLINPTLIRQNECRYAAHIIQYLETNVIRGMGVKSVYIGILEAAIFVLMVF